MNPMIPFLTGWLASCLEKCGRETMRIADVTPEPPNALRVSFASGTVLRVHVMELPTGCKAEEYE